MPSGSEEPLTVTLTPVVAVWSTVAELSLTSATELALGAGVAVDVGSGVAVGSRVGVGVGENEGLGLTVTVAMLDLALAPRLSVTLT